MKKLLVLLSVIVVGASTAIVYYLFESALSHSIAIIWEDLLDTQRNRYLVIPATVTISIIFFGLQHYFDKKSENIEERGLGEKPKSTISSLIKVLIIGYFSLLAGASLGPEAILVPASLIIGGFAGKYFFNKNHRLSQLISSTGFIALFTAFFNSIIIGVLSILILSKQSKKNINFSFVILAILASSSSWLTLKLFAEESYFKFPHHAWHITIMTPIFALILIVAGYLSVYLMIYLGQIFENIKRLVLNGSWWLKGLVASIGLGLIFLLGGSLIEFTGNKSIVPMLEQAETLGLIGLMWLAITKMSAISWSNSMGYRGGLIFPTFFIASVFVAIAQLCADINFGYGLISVLIGVFIANRKTRFLF